MTTRVFYSEEDIAKAKVIRADDTTPAGRLGNVAIPHVTEWMMREVNRATHPAALTEALGVVFGHCIGFVLSGHKEEFRAAGMMNIIRNASASAAVYAEAEKAGAGETLGEDVHIT